MHFHKTACYQLKPEGGHAADFQILKLRLQCQFADHISSSISECLPFLIASFLCDLKDVWLYSVAFTVLWKLWRSRSPRSQKSTLETRGLMRTSERCDHALLWLSPGWRDRDTMVKGKKDISSAVTFETDG